MHCYHGFGLSVYSDVALPLPDVSERSQESGSVQISRILRSSDFWSEDRGISSVWFRVPSVGMFRAENGRSIFYDALHHKISLEALGMALLGPCMVAIMRQRGILTLHGSSVVIDGEAVCFLGPSRSGKSSLAASFLYSGYIPLTDDIVALERTRPWRVLRGYPRIFLRKDVARYFSGQAGLLAESPIKCSPKLRFQDVPSAKLASAFPLSDVYMLRFGDRIHIDRCDEREAFELLARYLRGNFVLPGSNLNRSSIRALVSLAKETNIYKLTRPRSIHAWRQVVSEVVLHRRSTL